MKKIIIVTLIASSFIINAFATVRTVSNHPSGGSQYSTLQAAYDVAINGDTLLIEGTNVQYGMNNPYWVKSLVVIGAGIKTNKQAFQKTYFNILEIGPAGGGSKFYGIKFSEIYVDEMNGLLFEDCDFEIKLYLGTAAGNITVKNCIFTNDYGENIIIASLNSISNILITNCIFNGQVIIDHLNNNITAIIDHCVFLFSRVYPTLFLRNTVVKNCIFYNTFPTDPYNYPIENCNFSNNICRSSGELPLSNIFGWGNNNFGSGNLTDANPKFVNVPIKTPYSLTSTFDFHLQPGSPGIDAGDDGTDIGIHGSFGETFTEEGEPKVTPIVHAVQIKNSIVAPNGTLNVQIQSGKPSQ